MIRALAALSLLAGLAGCASVGQPHTASSESISGRLSLRVEAGTTTPAKSLSGGFELQGSPAAGQLSLSTPLGTVMAQARWSATQAWLTTPQGETSYPDLDSLTQHLLGESLPVAALFDWLRGRPWPGAPSQANTPPADSGFQQLGWAVNLTRFNEGWVTAQRTQEPQVTVRARIDPP